MLDAGLLLRLWQGGCRLTCDAYGADQWNVQATIQRLNESLMARSYVTWFDLTNMKGSTMDAMSDAIEGADVMLYGVSLAYKESANVRVALHGMFFSS